MLERLAVEAAGQVQEGDGGGDDGGDSPAAPQPSVALLLAAVAAP